MTVHVTVPLDDAEKAELEQIARQENISVERLMARLVRQRLDHQKWLLAEIEEGIASAENEPVLEHDDVFAALNARIAESQGG
jgi:predicted transcriptional regulator